MTDVVCKNVLSVLCPMYLVIEPSGHIQDAGPTIQKLRPDLPLVGRRFLEVFEVRRPRSVGSIAALRMAAGMKLHLKLRDAPHTELKGILVETHGDDRLILNLSFGISILDAVRDYALTSADFAATDLAIEMLYLVEAKSAAMEASRQLNQRLQGARIAAEEQAYTDTLTGLKNRRAMDHVLGRLIQGQAPFAVMNIDLDYFKAVNDTLGHAAGDFVLQHVARVLVEETRDIDTVARVGGDEFVVLAQGLTDKETLTSIGRRIIDRLEQPIPFQGQTCTISSSIGTALSQNTDKISADRILDDADLALYASKRAGRARQTFYTDTLRQEQVGAQ